MVKTAPSPLSTRSSTGDFAAGFLLPIGFLALAGVLFATSGGPEIPIDPAAAVDPAMLIVGPRRQAMTDPPQIIVEGLPENCNACHQILDSENKTGAALAFHNDVILTHGMNNRCLNCHDSGNRELLTLRDGTTIPYSRTPLLCAQCHGTVYRDWERGTHGKTLGSWRTGTDEQRRLTCNQCHNPHSPRYDPYPPLPGPRTLRMNAVAAQGHLPAGEARGPLQKWLAPGGEAAPHAGDPRTEGGR